MTAPNEPSMAANSVFERTAGTPHAQHSRGTRSILGGRTECLSRLAVELGTAMERALVQAGVVGKMDFEELFMPV